MTSLPSPTAKLVDIHTGLITVPWYTYFHSPQVGSRVGIVPDLIGFYGRDSAGNDQLYGKIECTATSATNGAEYATLGFSTVLNGSSAQAALFGYSDFFGSITNNLFMLSQDAGNHPTSQHRTMQVISLPTGSGGNGVANADIGAAVFCQKANWTDTATAVKGELDGLAVTVNNGGPDGVGTPANRGDTAAILTSASITGTPGSVSLVEGFSSQYDATNVLIHQVYTSLALNDPATSLVTGMQAESVVGANQVAFRAAESGGTWTYAFAAGNPGSYTVTIAPNGETVLGNATGGGKGAGTLNASGDIYKNNSAYTNPDYALEHWAEGKIEKFIKNEGAKSYQGRTPLNELEASIKTRLRLPGIGDHPMGAFERADVLLEKLEEAYTYIIDLHKRVETLEEKHGTV